MTRSLAISVLVHVAVLLALLNVESMSVPKRAPSAYEQKVAGKESKIVWYKFRKELPRVAPANAPRDERPLRAENKAPQAIVSAPRNAPKRTQMVWTPAPELAPAPLRESPNLLAVKLPEMPPPPAKAFVEPPRAEARAVRQAQLAAPAPLLETRQRMGVQLPSLRLPPKPYVAPIEAPEPVANVAIAQNGLALPGPKLPPRPFTAPVSGAGSAPSKSIAVESPPALEASANSRDLNIAVVGLNPLDTRAPLPTRSSAADFSAGPAPHAGGAVADGAGKGLSVPDLFVRGPKDAKPDLIAQAYAAPTSAGNVRAAMRMGGEPVATVHVEPSAGAGMKVSGAPDPRFNGRDVYLMAIQMPNLTSYSGSWLMWYSGRTARETGLAPIAAPVAHRKVDPKYVATAVEERIEGRVQLACVIDKEGNVSGVELVRGLDDRLNASAREALGKWQFYPALRNGEPIDVDVLVEIPFRLAPRVAGR